MSLLCHDVTRLRGVLGSLFLLQKCVVLASSRCKHTRQVLPPTRRTTSATPVATVAPIQSPGLSLPATRIGHSPPAVGSTRPCLRVCRTAYLWSTTIHNIQNMSSTQSAVRLDPDKAVSQIQVALQQMLLQDNATNVDTTKACVVSLLEVLDDLVKQPGNTAIRTIRFDDKPTFAKNVGECKNGSA